MHTAFSFMDSRVLVTFLAGLLCSVALMYVWGAFTSVKPALNNDEWRAFKLIQRIAVSKSTSIYRFEIPHKFGLPVGQHVSMRAMIRGKYVMRSYTPISDNDATGYVDFLVKTYEAGNLSRVFNNLKIGDTMQMKGPKGRFKYLPNMTERIGMVAGGTGITPCLQILRSALADPTDKTEFKLIYANVSEDEILMRKELESLQREYPLRFSVYYFLNVAPPNWQGGVGFVTKEAMADFLPAASSDCRILMCGPPPMMNVMKKHLVELNYPATGDISHGDDKVFVF